jgi:threonine-phosphate decarboxylase
MIAPSPEVAPVHGGQLWQIAARFGIQTEQLLDFSANINPAGPPPSLMTAIQRALAAPTTLTTYPDLELTELKRAIACYSGVQPATISVANGFVPLLEAALRSLMVKRCLLPVPSFSEYRRTLENSGVGVVPFQLLADSSFRYNPQILANACFDSGCDAILLANPQNPSGVLCAAEQMKQLIEIVAGHNITVLLDEAFIDYCPDHSMVRVAVEHRRVVVFRSVTKFFAAPGLRVAYAISNSWVTERLDRFIAPWPITSLASDAVCAALRDDAYEEESRVANERRRSWLQQELALLKVVTYPSAANFLLLRFPGNVDVGRLWERMIADWQIVLRSCANFEGLPGGHLRIAVRSESENARLIRGLEQVLSDLQQ